MRVIMFAIFWASLLPGCHAVLVVSDTKLRGGVTTAIEAFTNAEADSEMGQDLGLDLLVKDTSSSSSDPANLADYCAGKGAEPELGEGIRVKANWEGYGTKYPGKVTDENSDGTVDIKYNDGMTEKGVKVDDLRIRKKQKASVMDSAAKPKDDPACKMQDFLKKLQDKLKAINELISQWLASQRAKMANEDMPKPPPSVTQPPPKPAKDAKPPKPGSKEESDELEKLKTELADLDKYIKELEAQEAKYDKQIQAKTNPNASPAAAPGVKTVDDLIKEYQAKIAQRNDRIKELLQRIQEQKAELARLGESPLSLKDIEEMVKELEKDVVEGQKKRDELEKAGELDPELAKVIDDIIAALAKLRKKVDNLMAQEAKAKAEKEKAEQEAKEAEEAARKKAREEGKNEEEAAAEAAAAAKKKAAEKKRKADMETMKAAQEVEKDLKEAEKGANELDTGLHPHGDKWWRYRYEHSHIEALVMIFISFLMLLWCEFFRFLKHKTDLWSLPPGGKPLTEMEEIEEETHGVIYALWLNNLANQMLVCIFVFLTVWLIAKTQLVDLFPVIIKPSEDMHVPHTGEEYRHIALDICTIFFFAIVFYFCLMFAVAHEIRNTTSDLETLEQKLGSARSGRRATHAASQKTMGSVASDQEGFKNMQQHFVSSLGEMMKRDDPELKEISRLLNDNFNNFPLAKYLKMNMRLNGVQLFKFSWSMWLPMIGLFVVLWALHRYAHMGYVRIMGVAGCVVLLMIACMAWFTKNLMKKMQADSEADTKPEVISQEKNWHEKFSTESIMLGALEFSLFFVCYGVARMICQPWMWELHFWPVLTLTIVALITSVIFVLLVAPGIPSFIGAMSMPPYVDPSNLQTMKQVSLSFNKSPRPSPRA